MAGKTRPSRARTAAGLRRAVEAWLASDEGYDWSRAYHRMAYHPGIYTIKEEDASSGPLARVAYHHDPDVTTVSLCRGYGLWVELEVDEYIASLSSPA